MIKNNKNKFIKILFLVLIFAMALISFQLRDSQGFVPTPVADEMSPRVIFTIGPIQVTSTVVNTWVMMALLTVGAFFLGQSLKIRPNMLQNAIEWLFEAIHGIISQYIGRKKTGHFFPIVATFSIFIATSNLLGLIPGLSSPTIDINTPLAIAFIVFVSVPYFGIKTRGLWNYLKHYVQPIFIMLPIEIASEIARTFSLSFRLFGNIMGEEIIIAILFLISPFILPVPMMLFSIFTGVLQAYIFTLLSCVYIGGAVKAHTTK
jgi:F-type H+-transporting ATPase subunit a